MLRFTKNYLMTNRQSHLMIASLIFATVNSTAYAFDLLDAFHAAQAKDPTFSAARSGAAAGKTKIDQAKALKLPQVMATASAVAVNAYNKISDAQFSAPNLGAASGAAFKTQTNLGADLRWNISAEQSLYNVERSTMAQQLNKQAQLADEKLNAEAQQLIIRTAQAYFNVLLAEDTLASVKKQRAAVAQALTVAKGRFNEGDVAIIDTHEAQARDDALVSAELEANSNYQLAFAEYIDLAGLDATNNQLTLARPAEQADFQQFNAGELSDWITLAQNNSPSLHIQQIQQNIAHDEIDKYQSATSPILNLVAQLGGEELRGLGGGSNSDLSNHALSVGLQLTIPLFTGGMRNAKYEEAIALDAQAKNETEAMRIKAGQQARAAWQGVAIGKSKIKAIEQALLSSKVKLDATELGKEAGDRTTLDILNAEQEYYATRTALFKTRYQMLLSYLNLAAVAGTLDEKRLAEVNAILGLK